ncbi:hypothetical protein EIP91_002680 [Steccherinum ochraceum]|uniref:Fungal-type protein kinase domain-containing protein n=1 Tax=Steccherinum ochraceum TaxID=92696 RepID=A0A4R0RSG4_9APHY|nr:hypothetical protein EIP91_002680 [Steccherinum ochraceum]
MAGSTLKATPLKKTTDSLRRYAALTTDAKQQHQSNSSAMDGHWIGGSVYPRKFMTTFMKVKGSVPTAKIRRMTFNAMPRNPARESDMYPHFKEAIEKSGLLPAHFFLEDTSSKGGDLRPDGTLSSRVFSLRSRSTKRKELVWEVKRLVNQDPYRTDYDKLEQFAVKVSTDSAAQTAGQLASYIATQFSQQHHTFVITLLICGDHCRFILSDRSAAVVTRHFNYRQNPEILGEFIWRFGQLNEPSRGFDHTAKVATPAEQKLLHSAIDAVALAHPTRTISDLADAKDSSATCYVMTAIGSDGVAHHCVVQKPHYYPSTFIGPSHRTFVCFDLTTNKLSLLEDFWVSTLNDPASRPCEATILEKLGAADVPHLAQLHTAGPVLNVNKQPQKTITQRQKDIKRSFCTTTLIEYSHYRSVHEVLFALSAVKHSRELVSALRDGLQCLKAAHATGFFHRNLTAHSIMIAPSGEGIVTRWTEGLAKVEQRTIAPYRMATYQFMSIMLAEKPDKCYEVIDDLESCFWVLLYWSIHHFKSNATMETVLMFDDLDDPKADNMHGGAKKRRFLQDNEISLTFDCSELQELVLNLWKLVRTWVIMYRLEPALQPAWLQDPAARMLQVFDDALAEEGWPDSDVLCDQFPPILETAYRNKERTEKETIAVSMSHTGAATFPQVQTSGGRKRRAQGEAPIDTSRSRPKKIQKPAAPVAQTAEASYSSANPRRSSRVTKVRSTIS